MAGWDATSIFYYHGVRVLLFLFVAALLMCLFTMSLSWLWSALPSQMVVKSASMQQIDINDAAMDNYPALKDPSSDVKMIPGGSAIATGIANSLVAMKDYNAAIVQQANTTFGAPVIQSVVDRGALLPENDDWSPEDKPPPTPAPMPREIMLFSL